MPSTPEVNFPSPYEGRANNFLGSMLLANLLGGMGLPDTDDSEGLTAIARSAVFGLEQLGIHTEITVADVLAATNILEPIAEYMNSCAGGKPVEAKSSIRSRH